MSTDPSVDSDHADIEMEGSRTPTMFHMEDDQEHEADETNNELSASVTSLKAAWIQVYDRLDTDFDASRRPLLSNDVLQELRSFDDKQGDIHNDPAESIASSSASTKPHLEQWPLRDKHYNESQPRKSSGFEAEPPATLYVLSVDKDRFAFHTAMGLPDFIPKSDKDKGDTSLVVVVPSEPKFTIPDLSYTKLEAACPLLAYTFDEPNGIGQRKAIFEAQSRQLAIGFLRHIYQKSYIIRDQDGLMVLDDSLLFHANLYRMAVNYDVLSLKKEAALNMLRVTEFSCSFPTRPLDLCSTIRLTYTSLEKEEVLRGILKNYCVTCFKYHELKEYPKFCELVSEFPQFGVDLCLLNFERNFVDDGAAGIIDLSFASTLNQTPTKHSDIIALRDFVYHLWGPETFKDRCGYESVSSISSAGSFTVVHRPKLHIESDDSALETPSGVSEFGDEADFTVVRLHAPIPNCPSQPATLNREEVTRQIEHIREPSADRNQAKEPIDDIKSSSNVVQVRSKQTTVGRQSDMEGSAAEETSSAIRLGKKRVRVDEDPIAFDNRPNAFAFAELLTDKLETEKHTTNRFESAYEAADTAKALQEVEDMELMEALHAISLMEAQEAQHGLKVEEQDREKFKDKTSESLDGPLETAESKPVSQSQVGQQSLKPKTKPPAKASAESSTSACVDPWSVEDDWGDDFILL